MRIKATEIYSAMTENAQTFLLANLVFELTVWSRDAYPSLTGDVSVSAELLEAHNELQHRVSAQLMHVLDDDDRRYPDDVFVNILFDFSSAAGCLPRLAHFFDNIGHPWRSRHEFQGN